MDVVATMIMCIRIAWMCRWSGAFSDDFKNALRGTGIACPHRLPVDPYIFWKAIQRTKLSGYAFKHTVGHPSFPLALA